MDKTAAKTPLSPHRKPANMTLEEWQIALRKNMAQKSAFRIYAVDERLSPGDYLVGNLSTQQEYKVTYRGEQNPWNYCSCFDFKTSQLGTCKHIEAVKNWIVSHRYPVHTFEPTYTSVYLSYNGPRTIRIRFGTEQEDDLRNLASAYFLPDGTLREECLYTVSDFLRKAGQLSPTFRCYPDALEFILEHRDRLRRERMAEQVVQEKALDRLLLLPLYPYQKEGILFAFRTGRSILADEMGLGKTIQAIGMAELLRKQKLCTSVLILCPTSLKYQWKEEIFRFSGMQAVIVEGNPLLRRAAYEQDAYYKIVSYNTLQNDIRTRNIAADLLIMDEAQRLKNWKAQISKATRKVKSTYTLVLSGTPLQNKLEELYSIVQFVDQYCLGPYYRFIHTTTLTDKNGRIVGYKGLQEIGDRLKTVLLRRRRKEVALQLPAKTERILRVPMTEAQRKWHDEQAGYVAAIVQKWQRTGFLIDGDRNRLLLSLNKMRMACDSTYLIDQSVRDDTKIDELLHILTNLYEGGDEKAIVFSEWERMTRLVAAELDRIGIGYAYLHGKIPAAQRSELIRDFTDNPDCRVFVSTDTGSVGLNLQSASVLINIDMPWNPAVLNQRISRIYRIGQSVPVQIINLVTQNSIEERMLATLRFKDSLASGVLDGENDRIIMEEDRFNTWMKEITELMGEKWSAPDGAMKKAEPVSVPETASADKNPPAEPDCYDAPEEEISPVRHVAIQTEFQFDEPEDTFSEEQTKEDYEQTENRQAEIQPPTGCGSLNILKKALAARSPQIAESLSHPQKAESLARALLTPDPESGQAILNERSLARILQALFSKSGE